MNDIGSAIFSAVILIGIASLGINLADDAQRIVNEAFAPVLKVVTPFKKLLDRWSDRFDAFMEKKTGRNYIGRWGDWTLIAFMVMTTLFTLIKVAMLFFGENYTEIQDSVVSNSAFGIAYTMLNGDFQIFSVRSILNITIFSIVTGLFVELSERSGKIIRVIYGMVFFLFSSFFGDVVSDQVVDLFSGNWLAKLEVVLPEVQVNSEFTKIAQMLLPIFVGLLNFFIQSICIYLCFVFIATAISDAIITVCTVMITASGILVLQSILQSFIPNQEVLSWVMGVIAVIVFVILEMYLLGVVEEKIEEFKEEYTVDQLLYDGAKFIAGYFGAPYTIVGIVYAYVQMRNGQADMTTVSVVLASCIVIHLLTCIPGIIFVTRRTMVNKVGKSIEFILASLMFIPVVAFQIIRFIFRKIGELRRKWGKRRNRQRI